MAWPDFHRGWKSRSTNRWQHRLQREHPTCTERTKNRSSKSADGRVATVATRAGEKPCLTKKERIHLTPTGLLMEGHSAQPPKGVSECYGDVSTVICFRSGQQRRVLRFCMVLSQKEKARN